MDLIQANAWFAACPDGPADDRELLQQAWKALGCDGQQVSYVPVAGTAGKTSVAVMEAEILQAAGLACGLYCAGSAPLQERIFLRGKAVTAAELERAAKKLAALPKPLPRAAAELLAACFCFVRGGCVLAVTELSDTLLAPLLPAVPACAVTRIGADGSGRKLERLARIEAYVMRTGCTAVTSPDQPKAALTEIIVAAGKANCELTVPDSEDVTRRNGRRLENHMDYGGYEAVVAGLGAHARANAAIAVELALALWRKGYAIPDEAILSGMAAASARSAARLLRRRPCVLADPCRKPLQAQALAALLQEEKFGHLSLIAGLSGCRDPEAFFAALETGLIPEAEKTEKNQLPGMSDNAIDHLYLVTPDAPDALRAEVAAEAARFHFDTAVCADFAEAARRAEADGGEAIVVCGGEAVCRAAQAHFALKDKRPRKK